MVDDETGMAWDQLARFGLTQACLAPAPEAALAAKYSWARGVGARTYLLLPVLRDARIGQLDGDWRQQLPTIGIGADGFGVALATMVMELYELPTQLWEPLAAGDGNAATALNSWHHAVTTLLFDVSFVAREAIAEGRAPDDDWHRVALPQLLQSAVLVASRSFATALWPEWLDDAAQAELAAYCGEIEAGEIPMVASRAPWYWNRSRPMRMPTCANVDYVALKAARAKFAQRTDD